MVDDGLGIKPPASKGNVQPLHPAPEPKARGKPNNKTTLYCRSGDFLLAGNSKLPELLCFIDRKTKIPECGHEKCKNTKDFIDVLRGNSKEVEGRWLKGH
jgi:hypothetical protein